MMYLFALRMGISRNCFLYVRASLTQLVVAVSGKFTCNKWPAQAESCWMLVLVTHATMWSYLAASIFL